MDSSGDADFVVCSKCNAKYQPHVSYCLHCGAPTGGRVFMDLRRKEAARRNLHLSSDRQDLCRIPGRTLEEAKSLGSFLEEHGIPWVLGVQNDSEAFDQIRSYYYVCVEEEDLESALELEQEHLLLVNPGLAEEYMEMPSTHQCPACGAFVSPKVSECQSCGLALDGPPFEDEDEDEIEEE